VAWAAGLAVAVAWAAPWLAVSSFRIRRPERRPPEPGGGTEGEWRSFAGALEQLLSWAALVTKGGEPEEGLKAAARDLRSRLKRKAPRGDLEAACVGAVRGTWVSTQRWFWNRVLPEIRDIQFELAQNTARLEGGDALKFELLGEAMGDAAALVLRRLNPAMLAGDVLEGARECVGIAFLGAAKDEPLVELAAVLAMEWGNWILPWHPLSVRWKASEFLAGRDRDGIWDLPVAGVAWGGGAGAAGDAAGPVGDAEGQPAAGTAPLPVAPPAAPPLPEPAVPLPAPAGAEAPSGRRRVRVKVWRKEYRHRRGRTGGRRQTRRFAEIWLAFFQRLHYRWAAWWMYKR